MSPRHLLASVISGLFLCVIIGGMPLSAQVANGGRVTGQSLTAAGGPDSHFNLPPSQAAPVIPAQAGDSGFTLVPLPVWSSPEGLDQDGTVLIHDWNTGNFVRWRNGQLTVVPLGTNDRVNRSGEIFRETAPGSYSIEKTDGNLMNVNFALGPLNQAHPVDFNSKYAVGYMVMELADGYPRYAPVKWDLGASYTQLAAMAAPLDFPSLQPIEVNERGDFLAQKVPTSADARDGCYLNGQFFGQLIGLDLNNQGAALFASTQEFGPPIYWNGTSHLIGNKPGLAYTMNDQGEILGVTIEAGALSSPLLWTPVSDTGGRISFAETDLQTASGLTIDEATGINNSGTILLGAWNAQGDYQTFLLMPKLNRLGVDFDRNGEIDPGRTASNPDLELTRRGLPWFFWINDDDDADETKGDDIPGQGRNGRDDHVNGMRDLVDFFPVHLNIASLLRDYPASNPAITYKLVQADDAANFFTTDLKPDTVGSYHTDPETAKGLGEKTVIRITAQGVALERDFLGKILSDNQGIILVEACKETTKPLRLEVWRDATQMAEIELPLRFAGVETMFRHKNLVDAVNVNPITANRSSAPNWPDELNNRQIFVFLHGYNVNQKGARGWQAEVFKRFWWSGSNAQFWGVTWYGTESQKVLGSAHFTANYHANVVHAFGSAPKLAEFITSLRGPDASPTVINVAGHSLGNIVVSSAISDYRAPVTRYFMIDAAVAAEAYDSAIDSKVANALTTLPHSEWNQEYGGIYDSRLWASNWYLLFKEMRDDARATLTWRDRFKPVQGIGYYDFYSTTEEVLDYDNARTPPLAGILGLIAVNKLSEFLHIDLPFSNGQPPGHKAWQFQEQLKGRNITGKYGGSNYGGWGFNTFNFTKRAGGSGNGPVLSPAVLRPSEANALLTSVFTPEVLREEPFFRPGSKRTKVGIWTHDSGKPDFKTGQLGALYGTTTGSAFASTYRNTLLARMIPAISPAAGRVAVPPLGAANANNFDMDGVNIRPLNGTKPPWPSNRTTTKWWHSDLREVAYPYVRKLYERITDKGSLK